VNGIGVYSGVDANGLVVGGRGGDVTIANGVGIAGTVSAVSEGASATALRFGAGATTPELRNIGTVEAKGGNSATAKTTALAIDAGASVATIRNSGAIKATASGENGSATAIIDRSGNTTLVENSGAITAAGAKAGSGRNIAIDLSANTTGVTVKQTQVGSGFTAPAIEGDIRLGSGNDVLDVADGTFKGAASFGAGDNAFALSGDAVHTGSAMFGAGSDMMSLTGTSVFSGAADFGGGADTLTIGGSARFSGSLAKSANLAVNVTGGTLDINKPASIASLNVGAGGTLVATLDKAAGSGTAYNVSGIANFASGAKLALRLADVSNAEGSYVVLDAGTLQGASGLAVNTDAVPFLFKASLARMPARTGSWSMSQSAPRRSSASTAPRARPTTPSSRRSARMTTWRRSSSASPTATSSAMPCGRCCPTMPAERSRASAWARVRSPGKWPIRRARSIRAADWT
jgi:hypothetical protein